MVCDHHIPSACDGIHQKSVLKPFLCQSNIETYLLKQPPHLDWMTRQEGTVVRPTCRLSLLTPHPKHKACRTVLPSGAEKDQALLSCVFLHAFPMHTGHSEEHAQSSLSWARLLVELPQGPALGSPMGCTMFISAPQQDCLNSSKMVMKLYWSFEHSFSDPDRN